MPEWKFDGPPARKELAASIRGGAGEPTSYRAERVRPSGVNQRNSIAHEHNDALKMLRAGAALDQVDTSNLASIEFLARRAVTPGMAVVGGPVRLRLQRVRGHRRRGRGCRRGGPGTSVPHLGVR